MDVKGSIDGDGIFALNCIIGGLIGGVVLSFKIIGIVAGHFWTFCPKVGQSGYAARLLLE